MFEALGNRLDPSIRISVVVVKAKGRQAVSAEHDRVTRLRQVFESLITAVARAQNGPATLELGLTAPRVKGGTAQVVVAIRSIGRAAVIEKPLELTRAGVGLSLPIADSIVAAHGGKLRERWQGGKWAGFVVKL